jgi:hypothetical protein
MRCAAFPATFGAEKASSSGSQAPMGRAAHPDEITPGRADPAETDDRRTAAAALSISGSASS